MENNELSITIYQKHYLNLIDDSAMLEALRVTGVENWEGYGEALEIYRTAYPEGATIESEIKP